VLLSFPLEGKTDNLEPPPLVGSRFEPIPSSKRHKRTSYKKRVTAVYFVPTFKIISQRGKVKGVCEFRQLILHACTKMTMLSLNTPQIPGYLKKLFHDA